MMKNTMNDYELLISQKNINFAPKTLLEEVSQNIITICTTPKYSVPMDRAFGVSGAFLDEAMSAARNEICREFVQAVKRFEPRARITSIDFVKGNDNELLPKIRFRIIHA